MPEPLPESQPASVPEPAEDPWRVAFIEFKIRDEKMVKDFQEEIDTLLVVAGLFSAVLTAFVVESYQSLQEDYTQTSAELLRQISRQLANSSVPAVPDSSHFQAQRSDVRVNVCWFVSLLFSLVVALFGIFLKQWMRTYMKWTDVTPDREAVAIRQFRYRGLETWRLVTILTLLPTLLQLSVILFLSGLLVFLWNLDRMVAHVMAVLLGITFLLVAAVTVLPAVFKSCPFRSPLSEILAIPFWRVTNYAKFACSAVRLFIDSGWTYSSDSWRWKSLADRWRGRSETTSWVQSDVGMIGRHHSNDDHVSMYLSAMIHLCCTTQSQPLWSAAIAAIVAEVPKSCYRSFEARKSADIVYWNEVWWPVLGHIALLTEEDIKDPGYPGYFTLNISTALSRLPLPTMDCWLSFLMHSKTRVSQSDSDSSRVVESYLLCCISSIHFTIGGPCIRAFMEVLEAQYANLQKSKIDMTGLLVPVIESCSDVLLASLSDVKFVESVQIICYRLSAMHTFTEGHRLLLDVLVQLACLAAMATMNEPHERVPDNLKDLMHALRLVNTSNKFHRSHEILDVCGPALIFVARREPDLFPKPFARTIAHGLEPAKLWHIAREVDELDIEGIDVTRINCVDQDYLWESLNARTPNATELLIAPHTFSRILDIYEGKVRQRRIKGIRMW